MKKVSLYKRTFLFICVGVSGQAVAMEDERRAFKLGDEILCLRKKSEELDALLGVKKAIKEHIEWEFKNNKLGALEYQERANQLNKELLALSKEKDVVKCTLSSYLPHRKEQQPGQGSVQSQVHVEQPDLKKSSIEKISSSFGSCLKDVEGKRLVLTESVGTLLCEFETCVKRDKELEANSFKLTTAREFVYDALHANKLSEQDYQTLTAGLDKRLAEVLEERRHITSKLENCSNQATSLEKHCEKLKNDVFEALLEGCHSLKGESNNPSNITKED